MTRRCRSSRSRPTLMKIMVERWDSLSVSDVLRNILFTLLRRWDGVWARAGAATSDNRFVGPAESLLPSFNYIAANPRTSLDSNCRYVVMCSLYYIWHLITHNHNNKKIMIPGWSRPCQKSSQIPPVNRTASTRTAGGSRNGTSPPTGRYCMLSKGGGESLWELQGAGGEICQACVEEGCWAGQSDVQGWREELWI